MAQQNSINNETSELTIDPGASGDSFVQFDINTTGKFRIGVDDTDDSFRISNGSALGTNDTFVMTAAGERTLPFNSCFLAYLGTTDSNVTGDGTNYNLGTGNALTEVFDQNSDFNTNGTYTAPVTGKVLFAAGYNLDDLTANHDTCQVYFNTSNRNYVNNLLNAGILRSVTVNPNEFSSNMSAVSDMDAGDTAVITIGVWGSTKTIDVLASNTNTFFAGCLVS